MLPFFLDNNNNNRKQMNKQALKLQGARAKSTAIGAGAGMVSGLLLDWLLGEPEKGRSRRRLLLALLGTAAGGGAGALIPDKAADKVSGGVDSISGLATAAKGKAEALGKAVSDAAKDKSRLSKVLGGAGKGALAGAGVGGAAGGTLGAIQGAMPIRTKARNGAYIDSWIGAKRIPGPGERAARGGIGGAILGSILGIAPGAVVGGIKGALDD